MITMSLLVFLREVEIVRAAFFIMATGCLSVPNKVEFDGQDQFRGESYRTTVTGPASPSVFTNMIPTIEQHCEWITDCICALRENGEDEIEAEPNAENAWMDHNREVGEAHLRSSSASWYTGENIEGKPAVFMPYIGGFPRYREKCNAVSSNEYAGFRRV